MKQDQLAINTVSLRGDLPSILSACAEVGFKYVELPLGQVTDYLAQGHELSDVTKLLNQHDLRFIGGFDCEMQAYSSPEDQKANRERLYNSARLMAELGQGASLNFIVGTDYKPINELKEPLERYAEAYAGLAERVAPLGINLLIEFNWGAVKTFPAAAEISRCSGAANVGVLFDPAHFYCTATKSEDITPENVAYIKHVHVNNMRRIPAELSDCNSDRLLPNDPHGALNVKSLLNSIEANGYNGLFSIEMFSDELWSLPPATAAKLMWDSCVALCD